jgi:tRNA1(Val) A37 N6-methylase TrmN6
MLELEAPAASIDIQCCGSEVMTLQHNSVDLVMTSPPYYNLERYFDEPGQCWRDYPDLEQWKVGYLTKTLQTARDALRINGYVAINIDAINAQIAIDAARDASLVLHEQLSLRIGRDHFSRNKGHANSNTEPILVFKRA